MRPALSLMGLLATSCLSEVREIEHVDVPMHLDGLPDLRLYLELYRGDPYYTPNALRFSATLAYSVADLVDDGTAGCAQLDESFTATLGGVELPIRERGHWSPLEGYRCMPPSVGLGTIPEELRRQGVQLVLADSSRTITVDLGDVFVPRTAEPIGAPDWRFQSGEAVTFTWTPATDLAWAHPVVRLLGPWHFWTDLNEDVFRITDVTRGSNTISFTLPDVTAEGPMVVELGRRTDFDCDGVKCSLTNNQRVVHHAVVTAP